MIKRVVLGDGLLGSELVRQTGWRSISRHKDGIDFTKKHTYEHLLVEYDEVINCIAHTDTYDENRDIHWDVNYAGVSELVDICNKHDIKLIHISTDYIYTNSKSNASELDVPVHCANWYGYTKLLGDAHVQLQSNDYLIIRCSHKQSPFPFEKAYVNQIGNFDYVTWISNMIWQLIMNDAIGIYNVGTELKSMYDLALKTNQSVEPTNELFNESMPEDVSMDITKLKQELR